MPELDLEPADPEMDRISVWYEGCDEVELMLVSYVGADLAGLTPDEARRIAIALLEAADAVEARTND